MTRTSSGDRATNYRASAHAAAGQIGQKAPGDTPPADHVEWKHSGGQRAKERLLESTEMDM
jgi:hypothetical protein